ncbi:Uncharacterized protein BP5553_09821 [Venustampulla echinocandica]|uniref:Uncharacterized protein n=1 Tax=Venustampulla echinocandica TaxID=2656787 RepID=A0A370TAU3_9HELO|nr:Uncharacterized protein BP5553_09821 [Venustampulla echinocandica]RDL31032.1 Uncharacterized protein BP5553_09821 [Venustampulla echinocandica]
MKPLLPPTKQLHQFYGGSDLSVSPPSPPNQQPLLMSHNQFLFSNQFKLQTILSLGSLLQIILCATFPLRYAAVPATTLLLISILTTIQQCFRPQKSPFMVGVLPGRTTAQIPDEFGQYGPELSKGSVVVFHLGIQYNHPLGIFAPHIRQIANQFQAMDEDMVRRKDELGLLGVSMWRGNERSSNNTMLIKYYFKDTESVHQFAREAHHQKAWSYYNRHKPSYVGIFHETFIVNGGYENVYVNCYPVLLGRGEVKATGKQNEEGEWLGTLVSADNLRLN